MIRTKIALALALLLPACGDKAPEPVADDKISAEGEVLGGTISDAMLPLDTVRSRPPPLDTSPAPGAGGSAAASGGDGGAELPPAPSTPDPAPTSQAVE